MNVGRKREIEQLKTLNIDCESWDRKMYFYKTNKDPRQKWLREKRLN